MEEQKILISQRAEIDKLKTAIIEWNRVLEQLMATLSVFQDIPNDKHRIEVHKALIDYQAAWNKIKNVE